MFTPSSCCCRVGGPPCALVPPPTPLNSIYISYFYRILSTSLSIKTQLNFSINQEEKKKIMLDSAASWLLGLFTPTLLFVLLNFIVLTIVLSSSSSNKLSRSPSIVLDRLKSFNRYSYRPTETLTDTQKPEPEVSIARSQSDTKPVAGEVPKKLSKKMKKSASVKSAFNHFELGDDDERKAKERPATMRERVLVKEEEEEEEEEEVNARADDFISKFRHQLKLQRLDSLARYKEMLKRGN